MHISFANCEPDRACTHPYLSVSHVSRVESYSALTGIMYSHNTAEFLACHMPASSRATHCLLELLPMQTPDYVLQELFGTQHGDAGLLCSSLNTSSNLLSDELIGTHRSIRVLCSRLPTTNHGVVTHSSTNPSNF